MSNPFHADRRICGQGYSCPVVEAMKGSPRTTSVFMAKSSTPSSNFDAAIFGHNLFLATCSRMGAPFGKLSSRSSAAPSPEVIDSGLAGCSQCKRVTGILGSSRAVPTSHHCQLTVVVLSRRRATSGIGRLLLQPRTGWSSRHWFFSVKITATPTTRGRTLAIHSWFFLVSLVVTLFGLGQWCGFVVTLSLERFSGRC